MSKIENTYEKKHSTHNEYKRDSKKNKTVNQSILSYTSYCQICMIKLN